MIGIRGGYVSPSFIVYKRSFAYNRNMKTNFLTIKVAEGSILSGGEDGHVLVYSKEGDYYYSVSISTLFKKFDDKLELLRKDFESFKNTCDEKMEKMDEADKKRDEQVADMLSNYKENMSKVITMVESLYNNGGN